MTDAATITKASLLSPEKFIRKMACREGGIDQFALLAGKPWMKPDREQWLKWVGVFFRPVTPGKFMM